MRNFLVLLALLAACSEPEASDAVDAAVPDAAAEPPDACVSEPREVCGNYVDDTCDGVADEGCAPPGSLAWAKAAADTGTEDTAMAVRVAELGEVLMVMSHIGSATYAAGEPTPIVLKVPYEFMRVVSLARYRADGSLAAAWKIAQAAVLPGEHNVRVNGLVTNSQGDIFVSGRFDGTIIVGPGTSSPQTLGETNPNGAFAAKFSSNGELLWTHQISGWTSGITSLALLDDGGIAFSAHARGDIVFDVGGSGEYTYAGDGGAARGVIVWVNADGAFERAVTIESRPSFENYLEAGTDGRLYLASHADFIVIKTPAGPVSFPGWGIKLVEFGEDASVLSTAMLASGNSMILSSFARSKTGQMFVTGNLRAGTIFGPGQSGQVSLATLDNGLFVASFDASAKLLWVRTAGPSTTERGLGVTPDPLAPGGAVVVGQVGGYEPTIFGAGEPGETTIAVGFPSTIALFVARFKPSGDLAWVKGADAGASGGRQAAMAVDVDEAGNVIAAGRFQWEVVFGVGEANQSTLVGNRTATGFIARVAP